MCLEWRLRWLTLCSQSLGWQSFPHSPSWGSILLIKEITTCKTLPLQWELVGTHVWRGGRKVIYSNKRCFFIIILNCPKRKSKESSVLLYSNLSSIVSTAVLSCNEGYSRGTWKDMGAESRYREREGSHLRTRMHYLYIPHGNLEYRSRMETWTRRYKALLSLSASSPGAALLLMVHQLSVWECGGVTVEAWRFTWLIKGVITLAVCLVEMV